MFLNVCLVSLAFVSHQYGMCHLSIYALSDNGFTMVVFKSRLRLALFSMRHSRRAQLIPKMWLYAKVKFCPHYKLNNIKDSVSDKDSDYGSNKDSDNDNNKVY